MYQQILNQDAASNEVDKQGILSRYEDLLDKQVTQQVHAVLVEDMDRTKEAYKISYYLFAEDLEMDTRGDISLNYLAAATILELCL